MCIGAVLGIAGGVMSGIGAARQAKAQQASYEAQAAAQQRQAEIDLKTGAYEAARTEDTVLRTVGAQRAGFAANGLVGGSETDVITDTNIEGQLDVEAIRWNSNLKADNAKYDAKVSKMNADNAGASAGIAFLTPVFGAIGNAFANSGGFAGAPG